MGESSSTNIVTYIATTQINLCGWEVDSAQQNQKLNRADQMVLIDG